MQKETFFLPRLYNILTFKLRKIHRKFLIWRRRHMTDRQFLLLLSIIVGFSSGLLAVVLKFFVHLIQDLLESKTTAGYENYLFLIYPAIGIILTILIIKYLIKRNVGHGIPSTLYAISRKNSRIPFKSTFSSIITSMITVGFGGSVGLEGPTVGASSAIGSNYARLGRVNYKTTTLLLGCGAASAMSGIFLAPIAAIVFALEVIMLDLTAGSLIPLLMASVTATLTSSFFSGNELLFNVQLTERFTFSDLPFYILLGFLTGLISVYFCKVYWSIESTFEKMGSKIKRLLIGSSVLGLLIFLFPPLYGEGFESINLLLSGDEYGLLEGSFFYNYKNHFGLVVFFLLAVVFLKAIATTVTLGAGGIGGVFAPSLFIGSVFGFVYAKVINVFTIFNLSEKNFTLVGMGGVIAGILHAPLTALFLIAEITGGYDLVIPLMISAAIAFMTSKYFNQHSLYTMQLAQRGELITHDKDKAVLTLMTLQTEVEKDFSIVSPNDTLRTLVKVVSKSKRNIFPVVNHEGGIEGVVLLDDIRQIMFEPDKYDDILIKEIMRNYPDSVSSKDSMDKVMEKFNKSGAWNLPVIDKGKYMGFVSKSKLFNAYRKILQNFSDD